MFFQKKDSYPEADPRADLPEKTGPARFLELIKEELATALIVNVLFLVTCAPIITIPPALFSLHKISHKITQDEPVSCVRDYFTAFRQGWKRAYGAFFLTFLPMGAAGYGAVFFLRCAAEYPILLAAFSFCITVFLVAMLASSYLYGLLCRGRPLRDAIRTALVLGVAKPLRALLAALCFYGLPLLAALFFPISGAYLALLGFSLPFLLGNFYIRTVLRNL